MHPNNVVHDLTGNLYIKRDDGTWTQLLGLTGMYAIDDETFPEDWECCDRNAAISQEFDRRVSCLLDEAVKDVLTFSDRQFMNINLTSYNVAKELGLDADTYMRAYSDDMLWSCAGGQWIDDDAMIADMKQKARTKIANGWIGKMLREQINLTYERTDDKVIGIPMPKNIYQYDGKHTIVEWMDGTKTIVCVEEGEPYTPYSGFCAALAKKLYGSTTKAMAAMEGGLERTAWPAERKRIAREQIKAMKQRKIKCEKAAHEAKVQAKMEEMRIIEEATERMCVEEREKIVRERRKAINQRKIKREKATYEAKDQARTNEMRIDGKNGGEQK